MNTTKNFTHEELHIRAVSTAKEYLRFETALIGIFQELEKHRTFERYEMPSLFMYSTKILGLSEATTCMLTTVMRAANRVPELKAAVENGEITLSNARRIAPVLSAKNKTEWLTKAAELPLRKLELELAKSFPEKPAATRVVAKTETFSRLEIDLPHETLIKLKRAQDILAQKKQMHVDEAKALDTILDEFLIRHDSVQKAKRAQARADGASKSRAKELPVAQPVTIAPSSLSLKSASSSRVPELSPNHLVLARKMGFKIPRPPIPVKEKHALALRQNAQCTFTYTSGTRCTSTRWLHTHHITPVARGGRNSAENLLTLCSAHHKIVHCNTLSGREKVIK